MIVGFTGTRKGMSERQVVWLGEFLLPRKTTITEVHHGDAIGVDALVHHIVKAFIPEVIRHRHPPTNHKFWADCWDAEVTHPERGYLDRDMDIVQACDLLIGFPSGPEILRSGTWTTIRMARNLSRPHIYVMPDGTAYD